jgi:hypothetical protein
MKILNIAVAGIAFLLIPSVTVGQNWMMAQHYMTLSIDSLIAMHWPNTGKLAGYKITYLEYDDIFEAYTIQFTDTIVGSKLDMPLNNNEKADIIVSSGELRVNLAGGEAAYEDEKGEITIINLPDLSNMIYIFNEVGKKISFSLSNDDKTFEACTLLSGEFYYYPCWSSDTAFIKMVTVINRTEKGSIYYKLVRGKGYRIIFDTSDSKFDVYLDERMSIEDFKN